MADCVACICALSFTRVARLLGGHGDMEGTREDGGGHGENPVYGITAPVAGAALSMQRYVALYGATTEQLAAVPMAFRKHALINPQAIMTQPLTLADHQAARQIVDPLRLFDCSLISDGARACSSFGRPRKRCGQAARLHLRHAGDPLGRRGVHLRAAGPGHQSAAVAQDAARIRSRRVSDGRSPARHRRPLHLRRVLAAAAVRPRAVRILRAGRSRAGCRTAASRSAGNCR